jgi:ABC-type enterochelin transport system ATPase subunit
MNDSERGALSNEQMLFTMMSALVKREGGEIRISSQEMDSVTGRDMVAMYFDKTSEEIVLTNHLLEPPSDVGADDQ